ncbi:MAG: orotidine-5'-phosphate decarboxylase [Polyangia bacterium]
MAEETPAERDEAVSRLILALDVPDLGAAQSLLERLRGGIGLVKIGLELYTAAGPAAVELARDLGCEVFLDLKLHDIPNTVAGAVRSARELGVSMLTVHAAGGGEMLRRAREAAGDELQLLAVTLLTSLDEADLASAALLGPPRETVRRRAELAASSGCGGVVCSPREVRLVRSAVGAGTAIVTPGIRPSGSAAGDQKRAATPRSAISDGADFLVVGRPIREAPDPLAAAEAVRDEIAAALDEVRASG